MAGAAGILVHALLAERSRRDPSYPGRRRRMGVVFRRRRWPLLWPAKEEIEKPLRSREVRRGPIQRGRQHADDDHAPFRVIGFHGNTSRVVRCVERSGTFVFCRGRRSLSFPDLVYCVRYRSPSRVHKFRIPPCDGKISCERVSMDDAQFAELAAWISDGGLRGLDETTLVTEFCARLVAQGLPLARAQVFIDTLHPTYGGRAYAWHAAKAGTTAT